MSLLLENTVVLHCVNRESQPMPMGQVDLETDRARPNTPVKAYMSSLPL